jgi:hypothetical protein
VWRERAPSCPQGCGQLRAGCGPRTGCFHTFHDRWGYSRREARGHRGGRSLATLDGYRFAFECGYPGAGAPQPRRPPLAARRIPFAARAPSRLASDVPPLEEPRRRRPAHRRPGREARVLAARLPRPGRPDRACALVGRVRDPDGVPRPRPRRPAHVARQRDDPTRLDARRPRGRPVRKRLRIAAGSARGLPGQRRGSRLHARPHVAAARPGLAGWTS